ncbi:MAG: L-histidine N(alpha)-methyltransferase [Planctomycetota bacterium]|jgi:dimethylhistidine N-methyltransferase
MSRDDALEVLRRDAVEGLSNDRKTIPSKHLYDDRGSRLFDDICELDEYYPTRTELAIMNDNIEEIAQALGPKGVLIELGSGSSVKTQLLLDKLPDLSAYVPIDIADTHLERTAQDLQTRYTDIPIVPVCADFTKDVELPIDEYDDSRRMVYFPGSTIGNLVAGQAQHLLQRMSEMCEEEGAVLIGVDLHKDTETLENAYNDKEGVTAEFNLNLLQRLNRELDADFQLDKFEHRAVYDEQKKRVEMHLVSQQLQTVNLEGNAIEFEPGESILTEYSHKYSLDGFASTAQKAGLKVEQVWTDDEDLFSVQYLTPA